MSTCYTYNARSILPYIRASNNTIQKAIGTKHHRTFEYSPSPVVSRWCFFKSKSDEKSEISHPMLDFNFIVFWYHQTLWLFWFSFLSLNTLSSCRGLHEAASKADYSTSRNSAEGRRDSTTSLRRAWLLYCCQTSILRFLQFPGQSRTLVLNFQILVL